MRSGWSFYTKEWSKSMYVCGCASTCSCNLQLDLKKSLCGVQVVNKESESTILYFKRSASFRAASARRRRRRRRVGFVCLLSSSPARLPGDISIKLLFGSEATQMHLELVMDFASVKASDAVLIVPTGYS